MDPKQFLDYIIRPALDGMGQTSPKAETLLLATAAQESHCGEYVHQIGGPALGFFQMEPATHKLVKDWLWENRGHLYDVIGCKNSADDRLIWDLRYATQMARSLYLSVMYPLPDQKPDACFLYYKTHYNSARGAATQAEFNSNWQKYVAPTL